MLVGVGSICNLLELDLQMPDWGWKHLQFAGIGFADAWSGVGSICNLLDMNLQIHIRGSEASAICWNWICRCGWGWKHLQLAGLDLQMPVGVGSICNLLELDLQMRPGLEASAICWNWICRCISRVRKHLQLAGIGFVDAYPGFGSICNLLEWICRCISWGRKHLQLAGIGFADAGRGWKHPQLAGYEFADAYHQVDIKNPTTIAVGLFFMSKKEQNVLVDLRSILC